jgi:hypothetical protein
MRQAAAGSLALVVLAAAPVWADEPKVKVQAEVVQAQEKAGAIDPGLQAMQAALEQKTKYGTLKRLSVQKLELTSKPNRVALPNGKTAELSLVTLDQGVATVKVKLPPSESTLKLGREGSLYQHAGKWQSGDVWLVLSQPK